MQMAAGTPVLPGGSNTYIKDFRSSGKLQIGFSRNPKKFPLPNYCQTVPVERDAGFYLNINVEQAGRIVDADLQEFVWPDGADQPINNDGTENFNFKDYRTKRYAYGFKLGQKAREQADWDIEKTEAAILAQRAMTARTVKAVQTLTTDANWDSTHIATVSGISGNTGNWAASTTARQDIKRSLHYGDEIISADTLGVVEQDQLMLLMNPNTAKAIARCQEIVDHIKGSPEAYDQVRGGRGKFAKYGLPDTLYGYPIVLENSFRVTTVRGATKATQRVLPDGVAFLISQVGGLVNENEGPNFSTLSMFVYEDMSVETKNDPDNRRSLGRIVDDFDVVLTAPASGFYFKGLI
jgi:hypothetical protein